MAARQTAESFSSHFNTQADCAARTQSERSAFGARHERERNQAVLDVAVTQVRFISRSAPYPPLRPKARHYKLIKSNAYRVQNRSKITIMFCPLSVARAHVSFN